MTQLHKLISTSLGIGYLGKGGGTVTTGVACLCWYLLWQGGGNEFVLWQASATFLITALGIWSANKMERYWGKILKSSG